MADQKTESVRPIRALLRGMQALAALRASPEGLTVSQTARQARLPRTTAYRVLETLRLGGFVRRDEGERYFATPRAAELLDDAAVPPITRPHQANGHADAA